MTPSPGDAAPEPRPAWAALRFRHPWRGYQERVLAALDAHFEDGHVHLVAPPGSGKTVLGLEVARRLGGAALVLTPTLTIREQWIARLERDFAGDGPSLAVSRELDAPGDLTVLTYQALHARHRRDPSLGATLARAGLGTLVVDEAHHLRRSWWRSLEAVRADWQAATPLRVVALTATPPYDAPAPEWNRYLGFCGPVDEEIGIPELVAAGDLCPHQDLVYLTPPIEAEADAYRRFHDGVGMLVRDLALDDALAAELAADPRVAAPADHLETLAGDAQLWLAVALFLGNLRWETARLLLESLGLRDVRLPPLDAGWAEALLRGVVLGKAPAVTAETRHRYRQRLVELGALSRHRLALQAPPRTRSRLASSPAKVDAVARIVEVEAAADPIGLRLAILVDRVRPSLAEGEDPRLGVVPVFDALRRRRLAGVRPAILTAERVVLPRAAHAAWAAGVAPTAVPCPTGWEPLPHDDGFLALDARGKAGITAAVTELLSHGEINVLVGTTMLLGEGWDAPALTALVLGSGAGTHVLSNQMRGRAIRTEAGNPAKTANLWHLACVEPPATVEARVAAGGELDLLERRFRAFVGLHVEEPLIESGLERLGLATHPVPGAEAMTASNARMAGRAADRPRLDARWRAALVREDGRVASLRHELEMPASVTVPSLLVRVEAADGVLARVARWWARRRLRRIARAVAGAMAAKGEIGGDAWPSVGTSSDGRRLAIALEGATYGQEYRFVAVLAEVFDPLASPRYLLRSGPRYWAVPAGFGSQKKDAERFAIEWRRHVGRAELVFTRNAVGRAHLLLAKRAALLARSPLVLELSQRWAPPAEE